MIIKINEEFSIDTIRLRLLRSGEDCEIQPKCVDVLCYLIEHKNRVVSQTELIQQIWDNNYMVGKYGLIRSICMLRKALEDNKDHQEFICTYRKKGYRYIYNQA